MDILTSLRITVTLGRQLEQTNLAYHSNAYEVLFVVA